ncbi:MAG: helix-turn-helix transcriptional regulator [Candidatus Thermoplasmatota archaeon]|jgi:DNA-binding HxlR family transcriptional regulator|nr:helix-turn-helix transcriptional regulator [Candidatus Thermoplasmatota archaeon]MCL5732791.1 helix-turn-helix transcriptional regulator [Candidatus Thermoplasmatota archaeon]
MPSVKLLELGDQEAVINARKVIGPVSRKNSVEIIFLLGLRGALRFNEIKKSLKARDTKGISRALGALVSSGVVARAVYPFKPPAVEYRLTEKGEAIFRLMDEMGHF